jgi:hypothetical protein
MARNDLLWRFWVESALSALFAAAAALTLWQPAWIEAVFGVDPDRGSGSLEFGLTLALGAAALLLAILARREWTRARLA